MLQNHSIWVELGKFFTSQEGKELLKQIEDELPPNSTLRNQDSSQTRLERRTRLWIFRQGAFHKNPHGLARILDPSLKISPSLCFDQS